jgi:hypothetical protein
VPGAGYCQPLGQIQMVRIIIIFASIIFFVGSTSAQEEQLDDYHHVNINLGVDLAKGVNAGIVVIPVEYIFLGFNYGRDVANFLSASDLNERYSIGFYYHGTLGSRAFLSAYYTKVNFLDENIITKQDIYSLNFGSFSIYQNSFTYYYHVGILFRHEQNSSGSESVILPNIGIGTSLNFF